MGNKLSLEQTVIKLVCTVPVYQWLNGDQMHFERKNNIVIEIGLKFVNFFEYANESTLVQVMALHLLGAKPLLELMMTQFTDKYMLKWKQTIHIEFIFLEFFKRKHCYFVEPVLPGMKWHKFQFIIPFLSWHHFVTQDCPLVFSWDWSFILLHFYEGLYTAAEYCYVSTLRSRQNGW